MNRTTGPTTGVRTAVVVVHGVCPHPRYEIQDEFAAGLCDELNARRHLGASWNMGVQWPTISGGEPAADKVRASALRVYADAGQDTFDVFEGYWSPIDKNQTTPFKVLSWLLRSLFAPLNGYARIWASPWKTLFDIGYLSCALLLVAVALSACVFFLYRSWSSYAGLAGTPFGANIFGWRSLVVLTLAIVGSYTGWNFVFSMVMTVLRMLRHEVTERTHWRAYFLAGLLVVTMLSFLAIDVWFPLKLPPDPVYGAWPALYLASAAGALKAAIALTQGFLVNFLGDVQIYCTQDENARFFELREKIRTAVESVILQVMNDPQYDRIFIAAHSLGSTIAMDSLIHIHEIAEESAEFSPLWRRLRGLITFGTALEKTRFFFDVRNPSFSASYSAWRDDVYGHLFTDSPAVLRSDNRGEDAVGIYWSNYWYFHDLVANEIASYRSTVAAGTSTARSVRVPLRTICANVRLASRLTGLLRHPWIHGDYLRDKEFWRGTADALTQRAATRE